MVLKTIESQKGREKNTWLEAAIHSVLPAHKNVEPPTVPTPAFACQLAPPIWGADEELQNRCIRSRPLIHGRIPTLDTFVVHDTLMIWNMLEHVGPLQVTDFSRKGRTHS